MHASFSFITKVRRWIRRDGREKNPVARFVIFFTRANSKTEKFLKDLAVQRKEAIFNIADE